MSECDFDKPEIDLDKLVEQAALPADEFLYRLLSESEQQLSRPDPSGEYAISEVLACTLRDRMRFADHRGKWMLYNDGIWQPITDSQAAEIAVSAAEAYFLREIAVAASNEQKKHLTKLMESIYRANTIRGALFFLAGKDGFATRQDAWDAHPWLLPCRNGVLDLKSLHHLRPHSPDLLFTKCFNADYNPQASCAKWKAHIDRFLPDPEVQRHVQRSLGMALVGKALDEKLEIWWGNQGGNGKSTTIEALMRIFGDFATMAAPDLLVQSRFEPHPTRLADLAGRRLVFAVENDDGKKLAEGMVKFLTGDGKQKARFMHRDFFEFEQTFDLFLITNHRPRIMGQDNAIWRRIRIVPFEVVIDPAERRPRETVVDELVAEADGILNWLLDGLFDWQVDNWWIAPTVKAATDEYRAEQDRIGGFIADCCEMGQFYTVDKGRLYDEYCRWCQGNGEDAVGKKTFGDWLKARGIGEIRQNKGRKWLGIRLLPTE